MAKGEDITTRFKVDISDLKKGITEANNEIKKANSEFNKASAGMDDWRKSSEGITAKLTQLKSILEQQTAKLTNYQNQLKKAQEYQDKSSTSVAKLKSELDKAKNTYGENSNEVKTLQQELTKAEKAEMSMKKQVADLTVTMNNQEATVKKTQKEMNNLETELKQVEKAEQQAAKTGQSVDDVLKEMNDAARKSSEGFTVMKGALADLVADGIRNAINAVKEFVVETINVGKNFTSSMSQVSAVSGATGSELEALREKAKQMGADTKFSATDAADAFNYMAMAGWKTEDMLNGIDGVLALAAASNTDLATTSDIVTDALTGMGYSASESGRLADVMAAASSNANTNVEMMGATFKYAAPIVGAMGYSMEDTAVAIGLMANSGIKAEQAGTSLRSMLSRLAAPPKEAADAMNALGISITNADGTMKPLNQVMDELRQKFSGLSETQQTQYAKQIAGTEAMSGFLAIVNAAPADVEKLTNAVNNSNGAAEKMAATMQDNLGGDLDEFSSKIEGIQIALYEKFEPALRLGVQVLQKLADGVKWAMDNLGFLEPVIVGVAVALGTLAAKLAIAALIKGVATAFGILNAAMAANPIALVVGAIALLVAAFMKLWNSSEEFRNFWIGLWEKIKNVCSVAWEAIKGFFTSAWEAIKVVWEPVKEFFSALFTGIKDSLTPVIDSIVNAFKEAWELIKVVWDLVKPFFEAIWNNIKTIFSVVEPILKGYFEAAWIVIKAVWDVVVSYFKTIWENIKVVFSVVKDVLSGFFKLAWTAIKAVWDTVTSYFKAIWDTIAGIFSVVKNVLTGNWKGAWEGIKGIVGTWVNYFKGVWNNIKSVFSGIGSFFKNSFQSAWNGIKAIFSNWGSFFKGLWNSVTSTFKKVGTTIANAVSGSVKAAVNGVLSSAIRIINGFIGAINTAISVINKIPGVNIGKLSKLSAPQLEKGGILKKGQIGFLEGNGAEAVVPLDKNKYWIKAVAKEMGNQMVNMNNTNSPGVNGITNNSNVNNFTQNIYAPKQPSRIELYRQTRNLLELKGGI